MQIPDKKVIRFKVNQFIHRHLSNYEKTVWLIGSGRSGSTWVSNLINYKHNYRELFEPFHPHKEKFLLRHQYINDTNADSRFLNLANSLFKLEHFTMRIDKANMDYFYRNLLIKDIFANLLAYYISKLYPHLKIILLIRNPFATALSKYKTRTWYWLDNPNDLLNQEELKKDYLMPFESLITDISKKGDYIEKQILIWSIIYYVPLLQFSLNKIHVLFYEDVVNNPESEITQVHSYINEKTYTEDLKIPQTLINTPSRVTQNKNTFNINSWKNELTTRQLDSGYKILAQFGFENLYSENSIPNKPVLKELIKIV